MLVKAFCSAVNKNYSRRAIFKSTNLLRQHHTCSQRESTIGFSVCDQKSEGNQVFRKILQIPDQRISIIANQAARQLIANKYLFLHKLLSRTLKNQTNVEDRIQTLHVTS